MESSSNFYSDRNDLSYIDDDIEMLWLELDKNAINEKKNMIIGTIYRRPGSDPSNFNVKLHETLTKIDSENKKCIYTGDFNLNLLNAHIHLPTQRVYGY